MTNETTNKVPNTALQTQCQQQTYIVMHQKTKKYQNGSNFVK
ncbi:12229_t:CDS:2, partial [Gigaspora rosea]